MSYLPPCASWLRLVRPALLVSALFLTAPFIGAQSAATGIIEGRVQNLVTGDYLNNARVAVRGTNLVALTDESGFYRLTGVPAGAVALRVLFTGLDEKEIPVTVVAGQSVAQDVKLTSRARYGEQAETVQLDRFLVESTRETDAAAIAVNEQRVALGQKSVISADQFGTIPDTNPGELMKWLPGVSVEYFANNIVGVSVRGLDAASTEIRFDGMPVASASIATSSIPSRDRNFEMMGSSSADISRVEIRKLRTPEDSSNALGGSINLVRRSAFEADKRRLTYSVLFTSHSEDFSLGKRDGIRDEKLQGWRPNLKLTWTDPVSKNFGYAITLAHSDVLARVHWSAPSLNFGNSAQYAAAQARVAAGRPLTTVSALNPMVTQDLLHDNPKQDVTDSASVKFDWRPMPDLKVSYSLSGSRYQERAGDEVRFTWNTGGQPTATTPAILDLPLGSPGTNGITADGSYATYGNLGTGSIRYDLREGWRNGVKDVLTNAIEAEWRRGDWTLSMRGSYSTARHTFKDTEDGFFQSTTMPGSTLPNSGIGIGSANPRLITVNLLDRDDRFSQDIRSYAHTAGATAVGPEVSWQDQNNMYIGGAVSRPGKLREIVGALRLWAKRDLRLGENPFAVRVGFDYDEHYRNVQRYDANIWRFVGADGLPSTADDTVAQIAAVNVAPKRDTYYDSPAVPRISLRRLYDLYVAHPNWFQFDAAQSYRFATVEPYEINEKTHAPWVEFTGAMFNNRLTYVGGVRYEKAEAWGIGNVDNGAASIVGITDPLAQMQARYVRKGARGEGSNDGYFPSVQLNYHFRENLILRVGYAKTQAKNRFQRSVIPRATYDFTAPTSGAFVGEAVGTVSRPNPNLTPWTADNFEASLQYYTAQGGVISAGLFRKQIDNVQQQRSVLLDTPAKLAELDLDPSFTDFRATTWINEGIGQIDGAEFEMRQPLDAWLPDFARGFVFTGSFNYNNLSKFNYANGNIASDFQNFYETQAKGSLGYNRGKLRAHIGVIGNGRVYRSRSDPFAGGPEGHVYYPPYTTVDFSVEYAVTRWAKLFVSGRNITDAHKTRFRDIEGAPAWSNFQIENNLAVTYTAGISGSF